MTGHINLGENRNITAIGIGDDLFDLFLRQECCRCIRVRFVTDRANRRQFGISLDLNAPALNVGRVEVHRVELVHRHAVDDLKQFLLGAEMAGNVHMQAAHTVYGWLIVDAEGGDFQFETSLHLVAIDFGRQ